MDVASVPDSNCVPPRCTDPSRSLCRARELVLVLERPAPMTCIDFVGSGFEGTSPMTIEHFEEMRSFANGKKSNKRTSLKVERGRTIQDKDSSSYKRRRRSILKGRKRNDRLHSRDGNIGCTPYQCWFPFQLVTWSVPCPMNNNTSILC